MSTERIRGNLSTQSRLSGNLYRSGGGGSIVTIEPVYNSGIKIADYSIDQDPGEIYIPNYPAYSETILATYSGNIRLTTIPLNDSFNNYDALIFTFGWTYGGTNFETVDTVPTSKIESGMFICTGGEGRYNYISKGADNTEIVLATAAGSWDGASIIREIRGVKY